MHQNKWKQDLRLDIRTHSDFDDRDHIYEPNSIYNFREISENNRKELTNKFISVKNQVRAILEIGVCRNKEKSFTHIFLDNKKQETIYIGIDMVDKSFLDNKTNNVYTIKNDSSSYEQNMRIIQAIGVKQFDFIFIDGYHSINQCYKDWEYTNFLGDNGIVAFHDVNYHYGPYQFIRALDKNKWIIETDVCPTYNDWGLGFAQRK